MRGYAIVPRGFDHRDTLQCQLHDFAALATQVRGRQIDLATAVRDGNNIAGLVQAALAFALVAGLVVMVGVDGVATLRAGAIARLPERRVRAVGAVEGVVEGIPETPPRRFWTRLADLVVLVIGLEDHWRISNGLRGRLRP